VVLRGLGDDARLVMVVHVCVESRFAAALAALAGLDELRSAPRSIRVIEEEFV
jgi:homoserine dehydrogenase